LTIQDLHPISAKGLVSLFFGAFTLLLSERWSPRAQFLPSSFFLRHGAHGLPNRDMTGMYIPGYLVEPLTLPLGPAAR